MSCLCARCLEILLVCFALVFPWEFPFFKHPRCLSLPAPSRQNASCHHHIVATDDDGPGRPSEREAAGKHLDLSVPLPHGRRSVTEPRPSSTCLTVCSRSRT